MTKSPYFAFSIKMHSESCLIFEGLSVNGLAIYSE